MLWLPSPPALAWLQVCVVGDFDPAELEECCVKYLGTISPRPETALQDRPLTVCSPAREERHQTWHLKVGGATVPAVP